jgi:hypothetical protein
MAALTSSNNRRDERETKTTMTMERDDENDVIVRTLRAKHLAACKYSYVRSAEIRFHCQKSVRTITIIVLSRSTKALSELDQVDKRFEKAVP